MHTINKQQYWHAPTRCCLVWQVYVIFVNFCIRFSLCCFLFLSHIVCMQLIRCGLLLQMSQVAWSVCWAHGWAVQKRLNRLRASLGVVSCGSKEPRVRLRSRSDEFVRPLPWGVTRWQCSLLSNYFRHLFSIFSQLVWVVKNSFWRVFVFSFLVVVSLTANIRPIDCLETCPWVEWGVQCCLGKQSMS